MKKQPLTISIRRNGKGEITVEFFGNREVIADLPWTDNLQSHVSKAWKLKGKFKIGALRTSNRAVQIELNSQEDSDGQD